VRRLYNLAIVWRLLILVLKNPDQRFGQIMSNCGAVHHTRPVNQDAADSGRVNWEDEFYLESYDLLERIRRRSSRA
jgi:hypothetical protein